MKVYDHEITIDRLNDGHHQKNEAKEMETSSNDKCREKKKLLLLASKNFLAKLEEDQNVKIKLNSNKSEFIINADLFNDTSM